MKPTRMKEEEEENKHNRTEDFMILMYVTMRVLFACAIHRTERERDKQ